MMKLVIRSSLILVGSIPALGHLEELSLLQLRATGLSSSEERGEPLASDNRSVFGTAFKHTKHGIVAAALGYQKCGTTMMSDTLKLHPDVIKVGAKELHYLAGPEAMFHCQRAGSAASPEEFYQDCFEGQSPMLGQALLDFTPSYGIPQYLQSFKANVEALQKKGALFRFVAVLREPAQRAVSSMGMKRKNNEGNYGNMSNEELDSELFRKLSNHELGGGASRFITDGHYVDSLEGWLQSFSKDSLLVVNNAALNDAITWRRIYKHLGLALPSDGEIEEMMTTSNSNYQALQASKYEAANTEPYKASEELMKRLRKHYVPYNKRLWKLLKVSPWW
mmetsp:Transcript_17254/g.37790  ORF Transcript_17254/g.37790 Transcript_17254/m.37790 type:complete len:335 (-) Transcript_17254:133-1137(-)